MPKAKTSVTAKLNALCTEFEKEHIVQEGGKLICRCCILEIAPKRGQVTQHLLTLKHQKNRQAKIKQKLLSESTSENNFNSDLCKVSIFKFYFTCFAKNQSKEEDFQ